jgi:hypothetical protein
VLICFLLYFTVIMFLNSIQPLKCGSEVNVHVKCEDYDMIYLLIAIGLPPGGSSTVHIYTQTIHITTQAVHRITQFTILEECRPCPVFARYTLAFVLQLRKEHG